MSSISGDSGKGTDTLSGMEWVQINDGMVRVEYAEDATVGSKTSVAPSSKDGETRVQIAFLDAGLPDLQVLIDGLPRDVEPIIVNCSSSGLRQIAEALSGRTPVSAIHILSHGSPGVVMLGDNLIDIETLNQEAGVLERIRASLAPDVEVLLYGCHIAAGPTGPAFIRALAKAAGANVASSKQLVGSRSLGGDWVLDDSDREVFTPALRNERFEHVLALNYILGDDGDNVLNGTDGDDYIYGFWGSDTLYGGAGNDEFNPGPGQDVMYGEDGNDFLHANYDDVTMVGGAGDDVYQLYGGQFLIIEEPFGGTDTMAFEIAKDASDVTIIIPPNVENLLIRAQPEVNISVVGNDSDNFILGPGTGNNLYFGGAGNDLIFFDTLAGKMDTVFGGDGNDAIGPSGLWSAEIDGGSGTDELYLFDFPSGSVQIVTQADGVSVLTSANGSLYVRNLESVQFADKRVSLGGPDTGVLNVTLLDSEWSAVDGVMTATGNATIGLKSGNPTMLRVLGATFTIQSGVLNVSGGTVSCLVSNPETPLFTGDFGLSLTSASGLVHPINNLFRLAGLQTQLGAITLESDAVRVTTSFNVQSLLLSSLGISNEVIAITATGANFAFGGTVDLAKYFSKNAPLSILGKIGVTSETLELGYNSLDDRLYLKGDVKLLNYPAWLGGMGSGSITKPLLELTKAEIGIKDGEAYGKGEITSPGFSFLDGWGLKNFKLSFDSTKDKYSGSAELTMPFSLINGIAGTLEAKAQPEFALTGFFVEAMLTSPGIPIFSTGVFLRSLGGGASNLWSSTEPVVWKGSIGVDWLSHVLKLRFEGESDFKTQIKGEVKGGVLVDDLGMFGSAANPLGAIKFEGTGLIDWSKQLASISGEINIVNTIKGTGSLSASNVLAPLITAKGDAKFTIPGIELKFEGQFVLKYSVDDISTNDYAAAWAVVANPLYALNKSFQKSLTWGVRVDLDGDLGPEDFHTFGANEVPLYSSWIVDASIADLMVSVAWENDSVGPVATRVIVYDDLAKTHVRQIILEANYAANGIAVIADWTSPSNTVIYISAPAPGLWDVEVMNPTGLGEISYSATTSLKDPTLTLTTSSAGGASAISIDYTAIQPSSTANLLFFADEDSHDYNGVLIGMSQELDASGQLVWNASAFTPGRYWIYALMEDGQNVPLSVYSSAPVLVNVGNTPPVASSTSLSTAENEMLNGWLPAASDYDEDAVTYQVAGGPSHGVLTIQSDGAFSYVPAAGFHGSDSFTYTVADDWDASALYLVGLMVRAVNDPLTGALAISGTSRAGQALAADTGSIADADGLGAFQYQWLRAGQPVGGATGNSYVLTAADVGAAISVRVSYVDGGGTTESIVSTATGAILEGVAPQIQSSVPSDDATRVAVANNLSLTFSEAIAKGAGTIAIKTLEGGMLESFNAATSNRLSISGNTLTIDPTANLAYGTGYKVEFASGSIQDLAGNPYAGGSSYNFTTTLVNPAEPKSAYYEIAQKFYVAYFGRPADTAGLANMAQAFAISGAPTTLLPFLDSYNTNGTVRDIVNSFGLSAESQLLYGSTSTAARLTAVYHYLFNRDPDAEGLVFWAGGINSGSLSLAQAALRIMQGAENHPLEDGLTIVKKIIVAQNFTSALDTPSEANSYAGYAAAQAVRAMLGGVDAQSDTAAYEPIVLTTIVQLIGAEFDSADG